MILILFRAAVDIAGAAPLHVTFVHEAGGGPLALEEVIEHYNSPVQKSATLDPNLAKHPQGLGLNDEDKAALLAFLKTL